jgi:hypothetical protein
MIQRGKETVKSISYPLLLAGLLKWWDNIKGRNTMDRKPSSTGIEVQIFSLLFQETSLFFLERVTARHKASLSTFFLFFPWYFNYPFNKMQIATLCYPFAVIPSVLSFLWHTFPQISSFFLTLFVFLFHSYICLLCAVVWCLLILIHFLCTRIRCLPLDTKDLLVCSFWKLNVDKENASSVVIL